MCKYRVGYPHRWKRLFDLFVVLIAVAFIGPLLLIIALLVKATDNGPVFFRQERIGMDFRPFILYKFRTMRFGHISVGPPVTVKDDPSITPIGRVLRKTKLDELPQLFNVLTGDISLVGPRPEVSQYVEMFKEDYKTVLSVRPGITDFAAIEYRNEEAILLQMGGGAVGERLWDEGLGLKGRGGENSDGGRAAKRYYSTPREAYIKEILPAKISLYKKYIAEQSFLTDLKIIARTISKLGCSV